jgi:hypothetical protein
MIRTFSLSAALIACGTVTVLAAAADQKPKWNDQYAQVNGYIRQFIR